MKKHIFSRALALLMAISLLSTTAFAASFSELQGAIASGNSVYQDGQDADSTKTGADKYKIEVSTEESGVRNVTLWEDVVYAGRQNEDFRQWIEITNKSSSSYGSYGNVVIDLNGNKIDGGNNDDNTPSSGMNVISVWGEGATLTVKDTSADESGMITGGFRTDGGSGVYVNVGATFNFESGNISGNKGGAAVDIYNSSHFNMTGGSITNNENTVGGPGGVYIHGGTSTGSITGGTISNNKGEKGGAIHIYSNPSVNNTISGVTMENNEATGNGGAVYIRRGNVEMDDLTIKNNKATGEGGAIWISEDNTDSLYPEEAAVKIGRNNTISGNTSSRGSSDAVYVNGVNNSYTLSVDNNGYVSITDSEGNSVRAVRDANGKLIMSGTLVEDESLEFYGELRLATDIPDDEEENPDGNEPGNGSGGNPDAVLPDAAATTIEDEEVPLAGLLTLADLLEELRQYEEIDEIELPEDFKWINHELAQAIYWGLQEELVVDTEDDPLDPDEPLTVGLMREVLVNFVEIYHGLDDFEVVLEGEDEDLVMDYVDMISRLAPFYEDLEAALEAKAA